MMNMKQTTSIFLILLFAYCSTYSQSAKETVSAMYTFDREEEISDWLIEGEGKAYIENGKLILEPLFFPLMETLMKAGAISDDNCMKEYEPYLYAAMKAKYGNDVRNYFLVGKGEPVFMGGHFNVWNRRIRTSENFAIEFDFTPLSSAPLHMLMFCGSAWKVKAFSTLPCPHATEWKTKRCTTWQCIASPSSISHVGKRTCAVPRQNYGCAGRRCSGFERLDTDQPLPGGKNQWNRAFPDKRERKFFDIKMSSR